MSFSRRMWFEKEPLLQKESMTERLTNRIRNVIHVYLNEYWRDLTASSDYTRQTLEATNYLAERYQRIFADTFWITIDSIPWYYDKFMLRLRERYFKQKRNCVYDFIEFMFKYLHTEDDLPQYSYYPNRDWSWNFINDINKILKEENSAYILLKSWDIVPITEDTEIESIEEALEAPYENVKTHIKTAIQHFKEEPKDYRNSIKESISAVEAMCCELTWESNSTLWKAIKKLKNSWIEIHPALEKWFDSIYWYTSDESWIRHSLDIDSVEATFDDAKYMLVSCSAFINYLIWKSQQIS